MTAMTALQCKLPDVTVTKPKGLAPRMFFHVYSGPNAIAFAQLSTLGGKQTRQRLSRNSQAEQVPAIRYCLKNIEVRQNYRNLGVGSALLKEIINFCQDECVSAIYGEAKGEIESLRRWYRDKGFELDSVDNIRLSI